MYMYVFFKSYYQFLICRIVWGGGVGVGAQYFELWFHNVWTECWQLTDLFLSICDLLKLQIMLNNFCLLWFFFAFDIINQFNKHKKISRKLQLYDWFKFKLIIPACLLKDNFWYTFKVCIQYTYLIFCQWRRLW